MRRLVVVMCISMLVSVVTSVFANAMKDNKEGTKVSSQKKQTSKLQRLKVSENKRFLVKEDGSPFFWMGDTAWTLRTVTPEDMDRYLSHRARHGFNIILVDCGYRDQPWMSAVDLAGNPPFLNGDKDSPNEPFWQNMDTIVTKAGEHGIYVALVPMWGGEFRDAFGEDAEKAYRLGKWLGDRYKSYSHVLWVASGEYDAINSFQVPIRQEQKNLFLAMGKGLHAGHGGTQLTTIHPGAAFTSSLEFHREAWLDFNILQSGHEDDREAYGRPENHTSITNDYHLLPTKPVLDGEPFYEDVIDGWYSPQFFHDLTRPRGGADVVRRKAYWPVFAGACGHTYGHTNIQVFQEGHVKPLEGVQQGDWRKALEAPGAMQMKHLRALMESLPFQKGVPDQSLLASEIGAGRNHVQANRASDGSYALVYLPAGGKVEVRLDKLSGAQAKCQWFDPRTGEYAEIGVYPTTDTRSFDVPGEAGLDNDWVLVLCGSDLD